MSDIKFGINQQVTAPILIGPRDVSGETKIRFVIENATVNNTIVVRGRIKGQNSWDTLSTFTGNAATNVNVNVYDEVEIEVTVYESTANYVRIIASGFNPADGSAIATIGVPFGDTITENPILTLTSSNNSIHITGDQALGSIDFTVDPSANPNSYAHFVPTAGTNPAATISGDTLTILSTDTAITVTGTSTSLDFGIGPVVRNNLVKQESRTISPAEFSSKQVALTATPAVASKTRLIVFGGPDQRYSTDFIVSGNILSWSGLGLDGIIETGSYLLITYP